MNNERLEVTRGSINVYRDLGHANADVKQFKARPRPTAMFLSMRAIRGATKDQ
jgi:hypothetical protein